MSLIFEGESFRDTILRLTDGKVDINNYNFDLEKQGLEDETGANGIWDLAGEIADIIMSDDDWRAVPTLQELLYNLIPQNAKEIEYVKNATPQKVIK